MSHYMWDEVLPEVVDEIDWSSVTSEQWRAISDALDEHVSNSHDFMPPTPSTRDMQELNDLPKIQSLQRQLRAAEEEIDAYRNSVKRRRHAEHVWIENGSVRYE